MVCAVGLKDEKFERVCSIDWDSPPNYDVYFDDDDIGVSTSIHIKETIQQNNMQVPRVSFWIWKACIGTLI